jgi:hypothetical protein
VTSAEIIFSCVVVLGFFSAIINHKLVAKDRVSRPTYVFMLGCFLYTESYIALERPIMWLYVSLNLWGLYWFWRTRNYE